MSIVGTDPFTAAASLSNDLTWPQFVYATLTETVTIDGVPGSAIRTSDFIAVGASKIQWLNQWTIAPYHVGYSGTLNGQAFNFFSYASLPSDPNLTPPTIGTTTFACRILEDSQGPWGSSYGNYTASLTNPMTLGTQSAIGVGLLASMDLPVTPDGTMTGLWQDNATPPIIHRIPIIYPVCAAVVPAYGWKRTNPGDPPLGYPEILSTTTPANPTVFSAGTIADADLSVVQRPFTYACIVAKSIWRMNDAAHNKIYSRTPNANFTANTINLVQNLVLPDTQIFGPSDLPGGAVELGFRSVLI